MKYIIHDKESPEETEPIVRLDMRQCESGVDVIAVDANGFKYPYGALAKFTADGKLFLPNKINESLGFSLDSDGRLVIVMGGSCENSQVNKIRLEFTAKEIEILINTLADSRFHDDPRISLILTSLQKRFTNGVKENQK